MKPMHEQVAAWLTLIAFFTACVVWVVVGIVVSTYFVKAYRRGLEFKTDFREFLTLVAAHGALTDGNARVLTASIIEAMRNLPSQTAALAIQALLRAGMRPATTGQDVVPEPPTPHEPEHPTPPPVREKVDPDPPAKRRPPDSTRSLLMVSMLLTAGWLTLVTCGASHRPDQTAPDRWVDRRADGKEHAMTTKKHDEAGLEALRRGDLRTAGEEFVRAGDDVRLAEVRFREGDYDAAVVLCENHPDDKNAVYWLGRIEARRGNHVKAERLLTRAKDMGSFVAERFLALPNWVEVA